MVIMVIILVITVVINLVIQITDPSTNILANHQSIIAEYDIMADDHNTRVKVCFFLVHFNSFHTFSSSSCFYLYISVHIRQSLSKKDCYDVIHGRKDKLDEEKLGMHSFCSICFLCVLCASFHVLNIFFSLFCSLSSKIKIVIIVIDSNLY